MFAWVWFFIFIFFFGPDHTFFFSVILLLFGVTALLMSNDYNILYIKCDTITIVQKLSARMLKIMCGECNLFVLLVYKENNYIETRKKKAGLFFLPKKFCMFTFSYSSSWRCVYRSSKMLSHLPIYTDKHNNIHL